MFENIVGSQFFYVESFPFFWIVSVISNIISKISASDIEVNVLFTIGKQIFGEIAAIMILTAKW